MDNITGKDLIKELNTNEQMSINILDYMKTVTKTYYDYDRQWIVGQRKWNAHKLKTLTRFEYINHNKSSDNFYIITTNKTLQDIIKERTMNNIINIERSLSWFKNVCSVREDVEGPFDSNNVKSTGIELKEL